MRTEEKAGQSFLLSYNCGHMAPGSLGPGRCVEQSYFSCSSFEVSSEPAPTGPRLNSGNEAESCVAPTAFSSPQGLSPASTNLPGNFLGPALNGSSQLSLLYPTHGRFLIYGKHL